MRDLTTIIGKIIELAPELKYDLVHIRSSVIYTAPEAMHLRWMQVAELLNTEALNHPNVKQIGELFSGKTS